MADTAQQTITGAERPWMPKNYGIQATEEGMMTWEHVNELLTNALNYWIATTSQDGRPHVRPVWAGWVDNTLYFDGSPQTGWGRNIIRDPRISVQVEVGDNAVIVEGVVGDLPKVSEELAEKLLASFRPKYMAHFNYDHTGEAEGWKERGMFIMKPTKILAWNVGRFSTSPTRWRFEEK
jgi:hypothetical protein